MRYFLLLAFSAPLLAQCQYTFNPDPSQQINVPAAASPTPNTIAVTAAAGCNWEYSTDATWITFAGSATLFGSGSGTINWNAAVNLGPGLRGGHITVVGVNGASFVFTVVQGAPVCTLTLSPTSVSYPLAGGTGSFQVQTNCVWAAAAQQSYITLTSANTGSLNGTVSYSVAPDPCVASLAGEIAVQAGGASGPIQTFQITVSGSPSNLTLTPASLSAPSGGASGTLAIATATGCGWSAYSDVSWIGLTGNTSGNGNYNLPYTILANPSAPRTGNIHVGTQLFAVTQAAVPAATVTLAALGNGADYTEGVVSPGEVVVLAGTNIGPAVQNGVKYTVTNGFLPTTLGGVQVLFGKVAAPLLYVSANQVNAVAPFEVSGSTQVVVTYGGGISNALTLPVQATTPGILTLDASGFGGGAILNQDYSVNSPTHPAAGGSAVAIYCIGGGVTNPPSPDGVVYAATAPVQAQSATVTIDGINAQVLYSGGVPGSIAGLTQVNAVVPAGVHGQVPIQIAIGGVQSQSGVTIAIQ